MKKIFISYATADDRKRKALVGVIRNRTPSFEPVVVADRKSPGTPLAVKVMDAINEYDEFVTILTKESIHNQWVNQEIGFASGRGRTPLALVADDILHDLKGLIHNQIDLPFTFRTSPDPQIERKAFAATSRRLHEYLSMSSSEKLFSASISPKRVRAGQEYKTKATFRGTISNGFFDNYVVPESGSHPIWQPDPGTFPPLGGSGTPGTLNGTVDVTRIYTHSTSGWAKGVHRIFVRVYSHVLPGAPGRTLIAESEHLLEVV